MIIGRMDKRLILWEPVETDDGQAGQDVEYQQRGTVWAEIRKPTGVRLKAADGTIVSDVTRPISIRYREDVCRGWRGTWKDRTFEVLDTHSPGKGDLILYCEELVK